MVLNKLMTAARGQQMNKIAVVRDGRNRVQPDFKITRQSGSDARVAFVFSLAKKRQKQRLSGI